MKRIAIAAAAAALVFAAGAANASPELAKKNGCTNCHEVDKKKVGPAFKDIAAKYKGKADAADKIAGELKAGKGHPAVKASDDDIKALVKWVLAM
ncbi:MAG TPA: c-type cytochrome [Usitatibacter sp.]|nr:c-type cytochrome [Usitatibacter sp.]